MATGLNYSLDGALDRFLETSHVSDVPGVVVLTLSVCVAVHPSHSSGQTDGHADLNFGKEVKRNDIQVRVKGQSLQGKKFYCHLNCLSPRC